MIIMIDFAETLGTLSLSVSVNPGVASGSFSMVCPLYDAHSSFEQTPEVSL